ncbi:MAG: hypothetical protein R2830_26090 [Saprospiraceae bacterium]
MLSAIRDTALEWQTELYFLQNKSSSLKRIAVISSFSKRCIGTDGNNFKKEFSQLMSQAFPSFHKKLEAYLEELDSINFFPKNALESSIIYYREMHLDWQNLKKQYRQIEMQILDGVIKNYPATIF